MSNSVYSNSLDLPKTVPGLGPAADAFATKMMIEFIPSLNLSAHCGQFSSQRDNALFQRLIDQTELLNILRAAPSELRTYSLKYAKFSAKSRRRLLRAFAYGRFRSSSLAFTFVTSLGIKTCMHCNTAFTLAIDSEAADNPKIVFELDHFFPKSDYPYLSLSFFNLIPSCGNCNRLLSKTSKLHHPFEVSLDDLFSVSVADLTACIATPSVLPEILTSHHKDEYRPVFDKLRLADRYAHFADVAQEIIWRSQMYTSEYKAFVESTLGKPDFVRRALWGNYCTPDEYHKRPLSKFCTDICRQLGVL